MSKLHTLKLNRTRVKDLSPLSGLGGLKKLAIHGLKKVDTSEVPDGCEIEGP
jgi:hypothetical protein